MSMKKTYSNLITLPTFYDRYSYLKLNGSIGDETFGKERYLNQILYNTTQWRSLRKRILIRDNFCDLGIPGLDISKRALIHHINPITIEDILNRAECVFDPENLITTTFETHNAIHFGYDLVEEEYTERKKNDTCPWKE